MSIQLKVPSLGESVTQATIGTWLKSEGERVQVDEPLVEVESEKATVAVPAPVAGVLKRVLRRTGETVGVGEAIAELEEGSGEAAASPLGSGPLPGGLVPAARGDGQSAVAPGPGAPRRARGASWPSTGSISARSPARGRAVRCARRTWSARSSGPPRPRRAPLPRPRAPTARPRASASSP